jgi:hypothetical protein
MTHASSRLLGNVILCIGILLLVVTISGMAGLTPRLAASRELVLLAAVLVLAARTLRRFAARSATSA